MVLSGPARKVMEVFWFFGVGSGGGLVVLSVDWCVVFGVALMAASSA
ncbi:hypothetical protein A2U01_0097221, partial [Trifolium medium]|nr:hypothetical protein [Trifolium medium]